MSKEQQSLTVPTTFNITNVELNKANLLAMKTEDLKHTINGIDDKDGIKKATALRGKYRTFRTDLEKHRKSLAKPIQKYLTDLKKATDDLGKDAESAENFFDQQLTAIDQEKERIKQEKLVAEAKQLSLRINDLQALQANFDGETYTFPYNDGLSITLLDLKSCTDVFFGDFLEDVKTAFATEQTRLHELKIVEDAAEEQRLAEIEEQRQLALTNQANEKALLLKKIGLREKELRLMGSVKLVGGYALPKYSDHYITDEAVTQFTDEEWEELIEAIEKVAINNTEPLKSEIEEQRNAVVKHEFKNPLTYADCADGNAKIHGGFYGIDQNTNNPIQGELKDYSLNDFEKWVIGKGLNTGSITEKRNKKATVDAVTDYKKRKDNPRFDEMKHSENMKKVYNKI